MNIPKLSLKTEDWLQKKPVSVDNTASHGTAFRPTSLQCLQPVPTTKMSSGIDNSQSSPAVSACSLNNWLTLIKQHADLEEEHDFEIFDNSYQKLPKGLQVFLLF